MKTILVTGGLGYIGSHTVVELLNNNYDVVIIDNLSNSSPLVANNIEKITNKPIRLYNIDCNSRLDDIFINHKIDAVIHFAAYKSVDESVNNPLKYYRNNLNSLVNILDHCKRHNVNNIVFSSSCSLYGSIDNDKLPVNEGTQLSEPESPYAYTKLVGERIINDFINANKDFNAISLRYFNPVGADKSGLIGESPINKPNNIMPVICECAKYKKELSIFGNNYNTPDGTCIRDYIHVSDIANAHYLAIEYILVNKNINEVFNLGSESGFSVLELINKFEIVNGVKVNFSFKEKREGDIEKIYSDSSKAKSILGWLVKNNIDDMVSSSWKWYNSQF